MDNKAVVEVDVRAVHKADKGYVQGAHSNSAVAATDRGLLVEVTEFPFAEHALSLHIVRIEDYTEVAAKELRALCAVEAGTAQGLEQHH